MKLVTWNICMIMLMLAVPLLFLMVRNIVGTKQGQVTLDGGLTLQNVLFVPKLTCNLLSGPQLIDDNKCIVRFSDSFCVTHDRCSGSLIGAGERRGGL